MNRTLSQAHRRLQEALRDATIRDVRRLWPMWDLDRIRETWPPFREALLLLIDERGKVSAGLAGAYYRAARRSAGIPGDPPPIRSTPSVAERIAALEAEGPVNTLRQLWRGRDIADVAGTTLTNLEGVVDKMVLDHGRDVILNAVRADKHARGWERQTGGAPCDFCSMLADRGAVYRTEAADFEAHRHCSCSAAPAF